MKKVTFKSICKIGKQTKEFTITEYTAATLSEIRIRALALNWNLVSVEEV